MVAAKPRRRFAQILFHLTTNKFCLKYSLKLAQLFCVLQKWSKGKSRDKLNNLVLFDKATYEKLLKEVPTYKLITPSVVSERLKVRGSLARAALKELVAKSRHLCVFFTVTGKNWSSKESTSFFFCACQQVMFVLLIFFSSHLKI